MKTIQVDDNVPVLETLQIHSGIIEHIHEIESDDREIAQLRATHIAVLVQIRKAVFTEETGRNVGALKIIKFADALIMRAAPWMKHYGLHELIDSVEVLRRLCTS